MNAEFKISLALDMDETSTGNMKETMENTQALLVFSSRVFESRDLTSKVDAIAFGRPFISNPDLPERCRIGAELNEANSNTFYGGDEKGHTDCSFLSKHTNERFNWHWTTETPSKHIYKR